MKNIKFFYQKIFMFLVVKFSVYLNRYTLFFLFLLKNIDCGYSLELPCRGGSNRDPQSMF